MGRHSGFWMSVALTTFVVFPAAQRLLSCQITESTRQFGEDSVCIRRPDFTARDLAERLTVCEPSEYSAALTSVPAGAVIVIGSPDITGACHIVRISAGRGNPAVRSVNSFAAPVTQTHQEAARFASGRGRSQEPPAAMLQPHHRTGEGSDCDAVPVIRHFLIPHFEDGSTVQQPGSAVRVFRSPRVAVYADLRLLNQSDIGSGSSRLNDLTLLADRICGRLELSRLEQIRHWIGPIADIDSDERLTIVLTELDHRSSPVDTPVLGCVRDRDFTRSGSDDDLAGDIIYLNHCLPSDGELDALLVHELAHAAIYCLQTDATAPSVSAWLNEAIAHVLEMKLTNQSIGFSDRIEKFQRNPAQCPIVADAAHLQLVARRGGSRAAAALFLDQFIKSPNDIATLLDERRSLNERIQSLSGQSFSDVFRAWTISNSVEQYTAASIDSEFQRNQWALIDHRDHAQSACRLYGTGFVVFRCDEPVDHLTITSDKESQLQITILE